MALRALAHIAGDADLGPRLLALTGLDAATLRQRAADPEVLAAVLSFLMARESDLIATARALDEPPAALAMAARTLAGESLRRAHWW